MKRSVDDQAGFLVRFMDVGAQRKNFEIRIARPVDDVSISLKLRAYNRKHHVLMSRDIYADGDSDYGGAIVAGVRTVGRYVIVPGSEVKRVSQEAQR